MIMDSDIKKLEEAYQFILEKQIKRTGIKTINREDISNFLFKITDGGREQFSIWTIRKAASKRDSAKRAGSQMQLTGRLGACKASIAASKQKRPELSTPTQYKKNAILRMCVSAVDGQNYINKLPPEKRTRAFDVKEVFKIQAGGEVYDII